MATNGGSKQCRNIFITLTNVEHIFTVNEYFGGAKEAQGTSRKKMEGDFNRKKK